MHKYHSEFRLSKNDRRRILLFYLSLAGVLICGSGGLFIAVFASNLVTNLLSPRPDATGLIAQIVGPGPGFSKCCHDAAMATLWLLEIAFLAAGRVAPCWWHRHRRSLPSAKEVQDSVDKADKLC